MRAAIDRIVEGVLALLMAVMICLVFLSVAYRYVLLEPITWAEEVARLCLVWVSFLGVYLAQRRAQHISVEALLSKLPPAARAAVSLMTSLVLLALMAVLTIYGTRYAVRFMESTTPLLDIPLGAVYAAMPLAAALVIVNLVAQAIEWLRYRHNASASGDQRER